jgi:hypothetical protein
MHCTLSDPAGVVLLNSFLEQVDATKYSSVAAEEICSGNKYDTQAEW